MNIVRRPAPTTARSAVRRGLRNAVGAFAPFALIAIVLSTQPVTTDWTSPEHGAAADAQAAQINRQYERAMDKCDALPANTLPGAAVIALSNGHVAYTTDAHRVDHAFNIALGEVTDSRVVGVNLCR